MIAKTDLDMGHPPTGETLANFFPDIFDSQWLFLRFRCFWRQHCSYPDWGTVLMFCVFTETNSSWKTCQLDPNCFQPKAQTIRQSSNKTSNNQPPFGAPACGPRQSQWSTPQAPAPIEKTRLPGHEQTNKQTKALFKKGVQRASAVYENLAKSTVVLRFWRSGG